MKTHEETTNAYGVYLALLSGGLSDKFSFSEIADLSFIALEKFKAATVKNQNKQREES